MEVCAFIQICIKKNISPTSVFLFCSLDLYDDAWNTLKKCDGIIVPGGFGNRGIEGKIAAIRYAREEKIPFLGTFSSHSFVYVFHNFMSFILHTDFIWFDSGICLGMQVAVIEYARNVLGMSHANSKELVPELNEDDAVIIFMPEGSKDKLGGTMRLGSR